MSEVIEWIFDQVGELFVQALWRWILFLGGVVVGIFAITYGYTWLTAISFSLAAIGGYAILSRGR